MEHYIIAIEMSANKTTLMLAKYSEKGNYSIEKLHSESRATNFMARGQICKQSEAAKAVANLLANKTVTKALQGDAQAHFCFSVGGLGMTSVTQTSEVETFGMAVTERTLEEAKRKASEMVCSKFPNMVVANVSLQKYLIDNLRPNNNPLNETCDTLGACYTILMVDKQTQKSVSDLIGGTQRPHFYSSAASKSVVLLSPEQKENGVALIDFGSSTTNLAVFYKGSLTTETSIPLGSDLITRDLMKGLELNHDHAEILKKAYGIAQNENTDSQYITPEFPDGIIAKRPILVNDIKYCAQARVEELLSYVDAEMHKRDSFYRVKKVVLTGGGARLKGLVALIERKWSIPTEVADESVENFDLACTIGMASRYAREHRKQLAPPMQGTLFNDEELTRQPQPEEAPEPPKKAVKAKKPKRDLLGGIKNMIDNIVGEED